ncbi:MAG: recombinase family protein [Elusimicrobia bacterium]|nr:recombinase family protein [Elusimicrobiota bacterium]
MKRCGLYIRVSTDRQAKVAEGSLKAQDELLTRHIELKNRLASEEWVIVDRYIDEGRSAKDTQGRPQYLRLMDDIRRGRINTVMCMALSRISRSTRDLLDMIEFLKRSDVDFICLKEDFDTTTAQGKCFVTIMGALNEFEREQTSERTRLVMLARGERGLWHAGPILGYDRLPEKKGYLVPNPKESSVVNAAFDTYLECGSILKTCELLTANGYRTKEYVTHEGCLHRARPFVYTSVQNLLTNLAYIGKREINKQWMHHPPEQLPESQRYKTVDGVWEPIVPVEKFNQVQALLRQNHEHNRNEVRPSRHFYLLNGGLLFCDACGSQMEGTAGTGKLGKIYYYYHCTSRRCGFRLPEQEVEQAVFELLRAASQDDALLERIVEKVNAKLKRELPKLAEQEKNLKCELAVIRAKADQLLEQYAEIREGAVFVKEKLATLEEAASSFLIRMFGWASGRTG